MMVVFVDTGAWFAYFVRRDPDHPAALEWMKRNRQPLITTDFVLDELLTLLKVRESHRVPIAAGELFWSQQIARLERIGHDDLTQAWETFRKYSHSAPPF
jgi:hypothetical protein